MTWGLNQYSGLSKSETQQNAFNAAEAQKGRDFSAAQAELERDWQEEMNARYNSISGKIEQAQQAGVNPLFAVTDNAVSPASAHVGGVAAPVASGSASRGPSLEMAGTILSFSKLKAEIDQMNAYTRQANGNALLSEIDALTRGELNEITIRQAMGAIKVSDADVALKNAQVGELTSRVLVQEADIKVKTAQLGEIASNIALNNASRELKMGQLQEVYASIANTNEDTKLKSMQILYVAAQTRSERLMSGLITQQMHLTRQQRIELEHNCKLLTQKYDHNAVMNVIEHAVANAQAGHELFWNPDDELSRGIMEALRYLQGIVGVNLSRGSFVHTSPTSTTSTSTVVDGK